MTDRSWRMWTRAEAEAFERRAEERAYGRWMREQEEGDARRDDYERRNLRPPEDQPGAGSTGDQAR